MFLHPLYPGCIQWEKDVAAGKVPPTKGDPLAEDDYAPVPKPPRKPRAPKGSKKDYHYEAYKPSKDAEQKAAANRANRAARMAARDNKKFGGWPEHGEGGAESTETLAGAPVEQPAVAESPNPNAEPLKQEVIDGTEEGEEQI